MHSSETKSHKKIATLKRIGDQKPHVRTDRKKLHDLSTSFEVKAASELELLHLPKEKQYHYNKYYPNKKINPVTQF